MDPASPHVGSESPPFRSTILGSLLRGRPRGTSQNHPVSPSAQPSAAVLSSPASQPIDLDYVHVPNNSHRRRSAAVPPLPSSSTQLSPSQPPPPPPPPPHHTPQGPSSTFSQMLRRRRSAGNVPSPGVTPPAQPTNPTANTNGNGTAPLRVQPPTLLHHLLIPPTSRSPHRIRFVPHLDSRRSLRFEPIARDIKEGDPALRIGRFTDRSGLGLSAANAHLSSRLAFKSKVVSRAHAEVWVESGGRFMIKDTKSSSGTFLNHVRLSTAGNESRPHQLKDGDILQLGVDYQGGAEDIYKSVKIKIEIGREWQASANAFNTNALKQLNALAGISSQVKASKSKAPIIKSNLPDCCICLFSVTIRQALFIAPCSHTFHFKCIRPLLDAHPPTFCCPLCRTFADLDEDVEVDMEVPLQGAEEGEMSGSGSNGEGEGDGEGDEHEHEHEHENEEGGDDGVTPAVLSPPMPIPITTVSPVVPAGENERERDAGAETEVENEGLRPSRQRNRTTMVPAMNTVADLAEEEDASSSPGGVDEGEEQLQQQQGVHVPGEFGEIPGGLAGTYVVDHAGGEMDVDDVMASQPRALSAEMFGYTGRGGGSSEGSAKSGAMDAEVSN